VAPSTVADSDLESEGAYLPLVERGISPQVWQARGYFPYYGIHHPLHGGDVDRATRGLLEGMPMTKAQRDWLTRCMDRARDEKPQMDTCLGFAGGPLRVRSDDDGHEGFGQGLLMVKHSVPGEPPVLPQLRPEYSVRTGDTTWHRHDEAFFGDPEGVRRHLEDEHAGDLSFPIDRVHAHEDFAKYLLAKNATDRVPHDHTTDKRFQGTKGAEKLRDHLRSSHGDRQKGGEHKHSRDVRGQHVADRIDIHPLALERLPDAERVFFVIEGTPKADAILTAILETDERACVFNVPSVTLWKNTKELRRFAPHLRDKQLVVVPDADWARNWQVKRQAILCRERVREIVGNEGAVCIAAPSVRDQDQKGCGCDAPSVDALGTCAICGGYFKGVDDFLAAGGALGDLSVLDIRADFRLALFHDENGDIRTSLRTFSTLLGVGRRDPERVVSALQWHLDQGLLELVSGTLEYGIDVWSESEWCWTGRVKDWPVFRVPERYRHTENRHRLEGDGGVPAVNLLEAELVEVRFAHELVRRRNGHFPTEGDLATAREATATWYSARGVTARDAIGRHEGITTLWRELMELRDEKIRQLRAEGVPRVEVAERFSLDPTRITRLAQKSAAIVEVSPFARRVFSSLDQPSSST
jgi:hypothetical protein